MNLYRIMRRMSTEYSIRKIAVPFFMRISFFFGNICVAFHLSVAAIQHYALGKLRSQDFCFLLGFFSFVGARYSCFFICVQFLYSCRVFSLCISSHVFLSNACFENAASSRKKWKCLQPTLQPELCAVFFKIFIATKVY